MLFLYLYNDSEESEFYIEYLKKQTKCLIIEKYYKYAKYLKEKSDVIKAEKEYYKEKEFYDLSLEYCKLMKSKIDILTEKKQLVNFN